MFRSVLLHISPVDCGRTVEEALARGQTAQFEILSVDRRVDLGDIAPRKANHGCIAIVGFIGTAEQHYARCLSFGKAIREVSDLVSGYFSSIWIRQMAIGDEHGHLSKFRLHPDSAI